MLCQVKENPLKPRIIFFEKRYDLAPDYVPEIDRRNIRAVYPVRQFQIIQISDYPEIRVKELKLSLVNKKERQNLEKVIWQKVNQPQAGLCYIFEEEKRDFYVP